MSVLRSMVAPRGSGLGLSSAGGEMVDRYDWHKVLLN